jgi:fatty acid synthase
VCAKGIGELLENGIKDQLPNLKQMQKVLGELKAVTKDAKPDANTSGPFRQVLTNIFSLPQNSEFVSSALEIMRSNRAEITSDKLLSGLLQGPYLKNYLDDVAENTPGGRVNVGEVGAGRDKVYRYIVPKLGDEPSAQFAYTAVDENVGLISADDVEEHGLKTAPWNVTDIPPADLSQAFDVVIASRLHEEGDLSEALNNIAAAVKERGFLILHETTQNFALVSFLAALHFDYDFMTDLDQRTDGPFCDVNTWRRLLNAAGFDVVGHQSDGMMQSLFLCRKRASQLPLAASFINVNNLNYSWVDEVKVALADESTVDGNIWLVATSGAYNGVTGLVACLRLEPNGHKVR